MLTFSTSDRAGSPCAKRLERRFGSAHQSTQLIRLERKCRIGAAVGAPQGEMLLDHAGAERHRGDCHFDAERVIGEPDRAAEFRCQLGNAPQVRLLDRRWISAHAVEQNQIAAAGRAESFNRFPISSRLAMPVDMITGLPVDATR